MLRQVEYHPHVRVEIQKKQVKIHLLFFDERIFAEKQNQLKQSYYFNKSVPHLSGGIHFFFINQTPERKTAQQYSHKCQLMFQFLLCERWLVFHKFSF